MQQGGSQYGVPPPHTASSEDMTTHMFTGELPQQHMAEAVPPINTRAPTEEGVGVGVGVGVGGGNYEELTTTVLSGNFNEEDEAERGVGGSGGGGGSAAVLGNRWPREETLALIKIRSDMDATFRDSTLKGMLWDDVSRKLADQGYKRSAKKCKEKFENVHKYYKRTKEGRAGRQDGKNYRFFAQLEALHNISGGGSSGSGAVRYQPAPLSSVAPITATAPLISLTALATGGVGGGSGGGFSMSTNSSSSESDGGEQNERKRKRRSSSSSSGGGGGGGGVSKKTMSFFKVLMKQLMDQQASMQQRFLETIEKREQDRMIREEAWKRQEMSRLTREHDAMAQERAMSASRDAAIINFLQKYTGQKISIPVVGAGNVKLPQQDPVEEAQVGGEVQMGGITNAGTGGDPAASSRWPKAEVHVLIKLRSGLESRYRDAGPKGPLWEEISAGMKDMGYNRNAKRCKEKWENINKYFKKVKESNKKRPEDAKTCPYFHQLDALYRKKTSVSDAAIANIAADDDDDNNQESNLISTVAQPQPLSQPMDAVSNVPNINGGINTAAIINTVPPNSNGEVRRNSDAGEDSGVIKPEHMLKGMIHAHAAMDKFEKHGTETCNIDDDDNDRGDDEEDNDDDDDDDDDEDEDDEQQKMAYKIEYQRTTVDNTSNGGTNQSTNSATGVAAGSFLAMVQ